MGGWTDGCGYISISCINHQPTNTQKQFNIGQGTIVDSGTTDTYLPRSIQTAFTAAFKKVGRLGG